MAQEPKVTGLSPMTGPPGTKITIRGENFGQSSDDIIELTINGADCLPYLEWKSPKKIITRCTRTPGKGDILITTQSGGLGTCEVQFDCYEEPVGPTDESAVWVKEIDYQSTDKERHNDQSIIDEYSSEISSNRFNPSRYLTRNHAHASIQELEQLYKTLKTDLANKSNPEMISSTSNRSALLKSNLPVIMECLQILERLSKILTTSRDSTMESINDSIRQSLQKTHEMFDPLLAQKDLVQSIENAMQVFRQNETLFNLPSAIDTSIRTKNYDSVVKEITGVLTRLKTINVDQTLTEKIRMDVTSKVDKLKSTIEKQLHQSCTSTTGQRSIDEVKKLLNHLNRLGPPISYDVWVALKEMSRSLSETLSERSEYFLKMSLEEMKSNESSPSRPASSQKSGPPSVVQFVQSALNVFHNMYYDIMALGQSYFDPKDEFACKESDDIRNSRQMEFDEKMISQPISHLCLLLRLALVPDSSKLEKPSSWPSNETETYVKWLQNVLQSVITCHIHLTKVNLPLVARASIDDFREFVFELRVRSMQILFGNATRVNKNLHHEEDWDIEVDDIHGGITRLPEIFERNVVETLRFASEVVFKTSLPEEKSILKRVDVQASMKELAHSLINSFIDSLDNALIDSREHPAESSRALMVSRDSGRAPTKYVNRLLITICNCQFTRNSVFPRLQDEFEKLPGLKMDRVFKFCGNKYGDYITKISDKFCRIKCTELAKICKEAKMDSAEELQLSMMVVNSQIFLVAPHLVDSLMTSIVNSIQSQQITNHRTTIKN